jgi:hypothetical protein
MDSPANAFRRFTEGIKQSTVELGMGLMPVVQALLPVLGVVGSVVETLVGVFSDLPTPVKAVIVALAAIAAAIGPILVAGGVLLSFLGTITGGMAALGITTTGLVAVISSASAALAGALGPALLVVATAVAAFKITDWIIEWMGWRDAIDEAAIALLGVKTELEPSTQQARAMAEASKIAGHEVTTWAEATKILAEHNKTLQAANMPKVAQDAAKSYADQARELLDAASKTDQLEKASTAAGTEIKDAALAAAVLGENLRRTEMADRA